MPSNLNYHPFKQLKLTKLAYVQWLYGYDSFRDFPIQFVEVMYSIRFYPNVFQGTRLNELPTKIFLQLLHFSFSYIQPEWFCLSYVTWCLIQFFIKLTKGHIFSIIIYYLMWHSVVLKYKAQYFMGFTFQHHWEDVWLTKIDGKILCAPIVSPRHCSSFVLNCQDNKVCNTVQTPSCVVQQIIMCPFLGGIPHFLARTTW